MLCLGRLPAEGEDLLDQLAGYAVAYYDTFVQPTKVFRAADDVERRLAAVTEAGGTLVSDAAAPSYWVIEDADGNRSCICTVDDRGE